MSVVDNLRNASIGDIDMADSVHCHFTERREALLLWCDVADEAERLWNEAFPESPIGYGDAARSLIGGAAAAGYSGAIHVVALALGVDPEGLHLAVSTYAEAPKDNRPAPMTPQQLLEEVEHWSKWRKDLRAKHSTSD